jgi:hypothetical protein
MKRRTFVLRFRVGIQRVECKRRRLTGVKALILVCLPRAFSLRDICRKDCSEVAVRSHFSPAARRTPSTRSALSSGRVQGIC